jgi:hypothetical protein
MMSIWLEDKIKEAIIAVHWRQAGDTICQQYFVPVREDAVRLNNSSAAWLANFISKSFTVNPIIQPDEPDHDSLDSYSLEAIAHYLEEHGYVVSPPD